MQDQAVPPGNPPSGHSAFRDSALAHEPSVPASGPFDPRRAWRRAVRRVKGVCLGMLTIASVPRENRYPFTVVRCRRRRGHDGRCRGAAMYPEPAVRYYVCTCCVAVNTINTDSGRVVVEWVQPFEIEPVPDVNTIRASYDAHRGAAAGGARG